ncbi:unnamed protein product [Caenorhabditis sp. 36 PRJEB53466]|nr:unnamed protein product [Caenorhabditis sp. 36 PRJEB53466]
MLLFRAIFWLSVLIEVPTIESVEMDLGLKDAFDSFSIADEIKNFNLKDRLAATDRHHLEQLNLIRSYVGSGWLRMKFGSVIDWIIALWKGGQAVVQIATAGWFAVKKFVNNIGKSFGFWKRKREENGNGHDKVEAHIPLIGPASKMNELRWNKRLSQMCYRDMKHWKGGQVVTYRNKTYRAFEHGSLFESAVNDFFPILKSVFDNIKAVWVCAQLLFTPVDNPVEDPADVTNHIFEYLFDSYVEVGCGTNVDGSWCLIGPTHKPDGSLKGVTLITTTSSCQECETECIEHGDYQGLCEASPDLEEQERLRKIVEGDVVVEEVIVEEISVLPPERVTSTGTLRMCAVVFAPILICNFF